MNFTTKDIITLSFSCCALIISIISGCFAFYRWIVELRNSRRSQRLEFLRDLFNGFSDHNWSFVQYWDFPGIYPPLAELKNVIPEKTAEYQKVFGERVVVLQHLNILLKVFSHKKILEEEDILGFTNWAHSWYDDSVEALRVVLQAGDTYPLDFIIWLRDHIFKNKDFPKLVGDKLQGRLDQYEISHANKSFSQKLRDFSPFQ